MKISLEYLEDRAVPTIYCWDPTSSATATLDNANNYKEYLGATRATTLPGGSDFVYFDSSLCTATGGSSWAPTVPSDTTIGAYIIIRDNWSTNIYLGASSGGGYVGHKLTLTGGLKVEINSSMTFGCFDTNSILKLSGGISDLLAGNISSGAGGIGNLQITDGAYVTASGYFGYNYCNCMMSIGGGSGTSRLKFDDLYDSVKVGANNVWTIDTNGELDFIATDPMSVNTIDTASGAYIDCYGTIGEYQTAPFYVGLPVNVTGALGVLTVNSLLLSSIDPVELDITSSGNASTGGYSIYVTNGARILLKQDCHLVAPSVMVDSDSTLKVDGDSSITSSSGTDLYGTLDMWDSLNDNDYFDVYGNLNILDYALLQLGYDNSGTDCDAIYADGDITVSSNATFSWDKVTPGALPPSATLNPISVSTGHTIDHDFSNYNWNGITWSLTYLNGGMSGKERLSIVY